MEAKENRNVQLYESENDKVKGIILSVKIVYLLDRVFLQRNICEKKENDKVFEKTTDKACLSANM